MFEFVVEGFGGCGFGEENDFGEQVFLVGGVELCLVDFLQYQEVFLDEVVILWVFDMLVWFGQFFSVIFLFWYNFIVSFLILWIKVKKGLYVIVVCLVQFIFWIVKLDCFKGFRYYIIFIICYCVGFIELDFSSFFELFEFLWVDFVVENSIGGGVVVICFVMWQLEYLGQVFEVEKDKMVWEILVFEWDIRVFILLVKVEELVNIVLLIGVFQYVFVCFVIVDGGGVLVEVIEYVGCEFVNIQVLQVFEVCDVVFVVGKESWGVWGV